MTRYYQCKTYQIEDAKLQKEEAPIIDKELEEHKEEEGFGKQQFPEAEVKDLGIFGKNKKRAQPEGEKTFTTPTKIPKIEETTTTETKPQEQL